MPSTFDYSVWLTPDDIENSDEVENESLLYLPRIYNNDSIGLTNGKYCDLILFEMCIEINDCINSHGAYTQLITDKYAHFKNRKLEVSTFIEEDGSETLIFDISLETKQGSGEFKYSHQHRYSSQYFTYICVEIKVVLGCKSA